MMSYDDEAVEVYCDWCCRWVPVTGAEYDDLEREWICDDCLEEDDALAGASSGHGELLDVGAAEEQTGVRLRLGRRDDRPELAFVLEAEDGHAANAENLHRLED